MCGNFNYAFDQGGIFPMKVDWESIGYWILALFGMFVIYQALRYIFGGSWALEGLVLAFLVLNFTLAISNGMRLSHFEGEFKEFKHAMLTLAKDFKEFREEMREFKHDTDKRLIKIEQHMKA
ncbi:MAG: hypothetical protein QT08_C0020G0011 [archaeon GW2011_AR17]|nr:MAG: hypothetical protein QT08_C0020G0011 [archaeon GW2011_AR17]